MAVYTVEVTCGEVNGLGNLKTRISSIFVIGIGSLLGALVPILLARSRHSENRYMKTAFFVVKYFGSGVIIATAFIHLLAPATHSLQSPCLKGPITEYDWAEGIALMTVFTMFFIELLAARMEFLGGDHHTDSEALKHFSNDSSAERIGREGKQGHEHISTEPQNIVGQHSNTESDSPTFGESSQDHIVNPVSGDNDFSYPPGGADHLSHQREHEHDSDTGLISAQLTSIFILEFGVIFHSIFIGLTLAVAGSEFNILYIVLSFHQTFEGLGLGTRLALTPWPRSKKYLPWVLGTAFGLTTPIAIAIGLGARTSFMPGSNSTMIVNGIFDSISAGILIYTGLVELMAHEFMFSESMRTASLGTVMFAFGCMCFGAGLMAVLGKWA